ncbi:Sulfotransfer 1 domain containing protein, partial [Asbolus verrucosus]
IIYIARNPLDVCVSSYYNSKNFYFNGTIEEYCKLFLHGLVYPGPYFEHVLTYWKLRNQSTVLFLKYEDIKQDTGKVIQQIASFLGNMIPDEKMPTLQEHLSFKSIKNNDAVNGKYFQEIMKQFGKTKPITPFIRSGKVGGYKEELPREYVAIFKKWMEKELETTGLTFKV